MGLCHSVQLGVRKQFGYEYCSQDAAENTWSVVENFWSMTSQLRWTFSVNKGTIAKPKRAPKYFSCYGTVADLLGCSGQSRL